MVKFIMDQAYVEAIMEAQINMSIIVITVATMEVITMEDMENIIIITEVITKIIAIMIMEVIAMIMEVAILEEIIMVEEVTQPVEVEEVIMMEEVTQPVEVEDMMQEAGPLLVGEVGALLVEEVVEVVAVVVVTETMIGKSSLIIT